MAKTMLMEVIGEGEKLQMLDGALFLVNPSDMPTCCTWTPTAEIELTKIDNGPFGTRIHNLSEGISIRGEEIARA